MHALEINRQKPAQQHNSSQARRSAEFTAKLAWGLIRPDGSPTELGIVMSGEDQGYGHADA